MTTSSGRILAGVRERARDEIVERAARAATGFLQLGVSEGDVVALLMRNDFGFFEASLAAAQIGAYATPLNWHATRAEMEYLLKDSGAKVLVAHADLWRSIDPLVPARCKLILVPTPGEISAAYGIPAEQCCPPAGSTAWDEWLSGLAPSAMPPPATRGSMIYTSGTSGRPKGVRREPQSGERLAAAQAATASAFGLSAEMPMVVLMNGPMYHSAPNSYGLAALRLGATLVLQPRFDPQQMLALIERHGVTHMHMVPTMMHRLLRLPEEIRTRYDVHTLIDVIHGAAPCPPEVKRGMLDWWGPVISEYYGCSETGLITRISALGAAQKPGSVGRPNPGVDLKILSDTGAELAPANIGQIYIHAAHMPDFSYHGDPDKRRACGRGRYVTVGDLGYVDADGYLFLCGRSHEMMISGGVNIYPAEIEAALHTIPGVRDCAVFGVPDEEFGEAVCAYVQADGAVAMTPETLREFLRPLLAKYKIPKIIEFTAELPREDSGKIFKRKLRAPYWEGLGRDI